MDYWNLMCLKFAALWCKYVLLNLTFSALSLISCLALSIHTEGTVSTHIISSSLSPESLSSSILFKRSTKAFIDNVNTSTAEHCLPVLSFNTISRVTFWIRHIYCPFLNIIFFCQFYLMMILLSISIQLVWEQVFTTY